MISSIASELQLISCDHEGRKTWNWTQAVTAMWPAVFVLVVAWPNLLCAQASTGSGQDPNGEGVNSSGYMIHSSLEAGYRYSNVTGSNDMFDTLVDLHQGPRVLEQSLSMQSEAHAGILFDDLSISSFGWGGDPDNALRARVEKNKWFNFLGSFRRDQNFFNYDLLANPLNPASSSPSVSVLDSPHQFDTTRRMSDVDLTLLPQSSLSFRLGFSHNNMSGPSFGSVHIGTDALLSEPWNTTLNSYRVGADWKFAPRTVLSYDEVLDYYRGDTDAYLASQTPALLPGGAGTVDLGLPIDTTNKIPCAVPGFATSLINSSGVLTNVAFNAYFSFSRLERVRTSTPTERLSLRSGYFKRLDLTASYSYSSADMNTPFDESFDGLESRTRTRAYSITGPTSATRISNVADAQATVHLTKHLRLINKFYFWAYRIPENASFTEVDNLAPGSGTCLPPSCTLLVPLISTTIATSDTLTQASFNQNWKRDQTELAWDITKKVGARIGYRYGDQVFDQFPDFVPGDENRILVHENTGLFGVWVRPAHAVRMNFDFERVDYDNTIVRMAPRKESRYRFQGTYAPRPWAMFGTSFNLLEDANANSLTNYQGHNRNYGFTSSLTPRETYGLELAYNYNDVQQGALICFNDTPPAGVVLPIVVNAGSCAANDPANPLLANVAYMNHTQYGMGALMFKPVKRATTRVGYGITSVDGTIPQFNVLQPLGSLDYKFHQPLANLSVDLNHNFAWNSGWNYSQYGEGSFVGPTAPRYYHANLLTESLRYSF
jgi:hypothetical protein